MASPTFSPYRKLLVEISKELPENEWNNFANQYNIPKTNRANLKSAFHFFEYFDEKAVIGPDNLFELKKLLQEGERNDLVQKIRNYERERLKQGPNQNDNNNNMFTFVWMVTQAILLLIFGLRLNEFKAKWKENAEKVGSWEELMELYPEVKDELIKKAEEKIVNCNDPREFIDPVQGHSQFFTGTTTQTFYVFKKGCASLLEELISKKLRDTPFITEPLIERLTETVAKAVLDSGSNSYHTCKKKMTEFGYANNRLKIFYIELIVDAKVNKGWLYETSTTTLSYTVKIKTYTNHWSLMGHIYPMSLVEHILA